MPKRNNDEKESSGSLTAFLIVLIFILIWLSVFALLIKFDAGNLGTTLRPYIKDIPVLNLILPKVSDDVIQQEKDYPYKNLDEAIEKIKELQAQNEALTKTNTEQSEKIAELTAENNRLKVYEDNLTSFEERVKRFEQYVVFNDKAPTVEEYKKFYEELSPANAEQIYREVLALLQYDETIKSQATLLSTMKPGAAAEALQNMTADIEWITKVISCMKTSNATDILNKMDSLFVSKILQRMSDVSEEQYKNLYEILNIDYPEGGTTK